MGEHHDLEAENRQLRKLLKAAQSAGRARQQPSARNAPALQLELPKVVRYPLAEFASARGQNVPLPDTVAEIAEVIGRGNAVRLVEGTRATGKRKWRRQLYVPGDMHDEHRIAKMIGLEAAAQLSHSHANCIIELPSCFALRKAYMADHALRLADSGAVLSEIAREMGVEQKTARGLLADADYWRARLC
ncbi:hypothetical protein FEE96_07085 [Parasedimentitalea maritima]|uniref:Mor transcription activator domain-containing protein n=1 Tax=Parasedimentitalea maritima TaxID=2578117 RepID=A0ABY2UWV4_9RHOB|nr:hypothetical protein [Zongyanglinia marina]TLP67104.1 hypothetical protein FEE96_07085 [Zongyanglinia marina]